MISLNLNGAGAIQQSALSQHLAGQAPVVAADLAKSTLPTDQLATTVAGTSFLGSVKNVVMAPIRGIRSFFGGETAQGATVSQVSAEAQGTGTGSVTPAETGAAAGSASTAAASKSMGQSIKDTLHNVLPKPEPFSVSMLGKRMMYGALFGVVGNAIRTGINVATGNLSGSQAFQYLLRDTIKGAVGGAGFGLGMGVTTMALSRFGVAGLPLTIASFVVGSASAIGSLHALSVFGGGWDWGSAL